MTDPIKALVDEVRDAAFRLLSVADSYSAEKSIAHDLLDTLTSYEVSQAQPAPTDAEIEAAISDLVVAWRSRVATRECVESAWVRIRSLIARLRGGAQ